MVPRVAVLLCGLISLSAALGCSPSTPAATANPTPTPKFEATITAGVEATIQAIPTATPTPRPTPTLTPAATNTPGPTANIEATIAVSVEATIQAQPTSTPTPRPTPTPTATPTPTSTSTPTSIPTSTPRPTLAPTPTPRPSFAEAAVIRALSNHLLGITSQIGDLEHRNWFDELVKTLHESPGSRQVTYLGISTVGNEVWTVKSAYLGIESLPKNRIGSITGNWRVAATLGRLFVTPADQGAREFDTSLRYWAAFEPTPTPRPTPTPVPFACASPSGVTVTDLSFQVSDYGIWVDVNARIANTCNAPVKTPLTAIVYGHGDTILGSEKFPSGGGNCLFAGGVGVVCLEVGESQVVRFHVSGGGFEGTVRVDIETRFARR